MRSQRFGIEIEMTGLTRSTAAQVIAGYFHKEAIHVGGLHDAYTVRDSENRQWRLVGDGSIRAQTRRGYTNNTAYQVEFVSPICRHEDIVPLQEMVRALRAAGAKVNDSCGIHVHVDAAPHDEKTLRNLVNIMAAKEDLLYKALQVEVARENYCKKVDVRFLDDIKHLRPKSMEQLEQIWYNGSGSRHYHYDRTRYHGLNLHSVFSKGTVEFRLFNSTLHAGEVKSYIQLCLAISHQALVQRSASQIRTQAENEKYTFRTWLLRLGMIGPEFQTARLHLLKHLEGNIAWRDPSQAEAQKERMRKMKHGEVQEKASEEPCPQQEEPSEQAQDNDPAFFMSM